MSRTANPVRLQLWKDRLVSFLASGQSVAEFCQGVPCSANSFYSWKRRIEREQKASDLGEPKASAFLPVLVREQREQSVSVQLPSGVSIRIPCDAMKVIQAVLERVA